ncbi:hypothetical protein BC835DRAFT_1358581 [Cytidiella melzeri]|nr:hypothetical protein BC835DRAFT_1358581 [Cytidiella melzeri]
MKSLSCFNRVRPQEVWVERAMVTPFQPLCRPRETAMERQLGDNHRATQNSQSLAKGTKKCFTYHLACSRSLPIALANAGPNDDFFAPINIGGSAAVVPRVERPAQLPSPPHEDRPDANRRASGPIEGNDSVAIEDVAVGPLLSFDSQGSGQLPITLGAGRVPSEDRRSSDSVPAIVATDPVSPQNDDGRERAPFASPSLSPERSSSIERRAMAEVHMGGAPNVVHTRRAAHSRRPFAPLAGSRYESPSRASESVSPAGPPLPLSDILEASMSPRPRRVMLSSPLPPSSPPRDSSSPQRQTNRLLPNDVHPPRAIEDESSGEWDELYVDQEGVLRQFRAPTTGPQDGYVWSDSPEWHRKDRRVEETEAKQKSSSSEKENYPSPPGQRQQTSSPEYTLPIPGSGDSAYSNPNFYRAPPSEDSINPEPMREETFLQVVGAMSSLSQEYRGLWNTGKLISKDARHAEMTSIIGRRQLVQERANFWRMNIWFSAWTNPAKKWHPEAIWKQPIDLELIDGRYYEVDDPPEDDQEPVEFEPSSERTNTNKSTWNEHKIHYIDGEPGYSYTVRKSNATNVREEDNSSPSPSYLQRFMAHRAATEPARTPPQQPSSPPSAARKIKPLPGRKRVREEDGDELEDEYRGGSRKISRITAPHTVAPLSRVQNASLEDYSPPEGVIAPLQLLGRGDVIENSDEDWTDEISVQSILEDDALLNLSNWRSPAKSATQTAPVEERLDRKFNPFLSADVEASTSKEADVVEVVDETGERHRRYSASSKGKGRAAA